MFRKIIRGIIFIGFSVQILLGLAWMACNFSSVQDFAEVSTGIYGGAVRLLGKAYPVMYVLRRAGVWFPGCAYMPEAGIKTGISV